MHFTHKACYYHAKEYSVGEMHLGGYLITFGGLKDNKYKKKKQITD